jgi:hypothetical protein
MFQPKPLNSAIAVALGALAAVSANVQADSVFFPHVVVSNSVTTIVSVVNTSDELYGPQGDDLHYTLMYKNAANNADRCGEFNTFLPSSENDLQTIDLGAPLAENGVLFEPGGGVNVAYTNSDKYNIGTIARNRMTGQPALRGFLLVDNAESDSSERRPSMFGEAIVVEFGVGATWGYSAFSRLDNTRNDPDGFDDEGDFDDAASKDGYPIQFLPMIGDGSAISALMITPVVAPKANGGSWADSDMFDAYGPNSYTTTVQLFQDKKQWVAGLYNRDEDPISGSRPQAVTCVGRVEISTLFADVIGESDPLAQGGWGRLANWTAVAGLVEGNATATTRVDDAAVIYKLEYGNEFNGLNIGGTWNNAFWIPNDFEVYIDD